MSELLFVAHVFVKYLQVRISPLENPDQRPDFDPVSDVKSRLLFFAIVVVAMVAVKFLFGL